MGDEVIVECAQCGASVDKGEGIELGENIYCPDCVCYCDECGTSVHQDVLKVYNLKVYCPTCRGRYLRECDCCGDTYDTREEDCRGDMCPSCSEDHFICDSCGGVFHDDDYGEDGYCRDCRDDEQESEYIHRYHDGNVDLIFYPNEGQRLYFGVELETDNYGNRAGAAEDLYGLSKGDTLFYLSEDSSLDNGIEIISQPCTLGYHTEQFPWRDIVGVVKEYGGKAEKTDHAAMHIHFSKAFFEGKSYELYVIRLIYLFEKFRPQILKFGRTSSYLEGRSAKDYKTNMYNKPAKEKVEELNRYWDRLMAVNLQTGGDTIEIRIFRSTLKVTNILSSLELVDFLVRLVKASSNRKLQSLSWGDMVKMAGEAKYQYLPKALQTLEGVSKGVLQWGVVE